MNEERKETLQKWLFAVLAIVGLAAAGIYIGIMSAVGISVIQLVKAAGFGIFGLLMFWGALSAD